MTHRHLAISLVAVTAAAVPAAGCGGSSGSDSAQSALTPSGSPAASSPKAVGNAGTVSIADFAFAPATLRAAHGAKIVVSNHDSTAHTVTADDGHAFDTGDIAPGASATVTLAKPGRYAYHCTIHPFMHGTLVVR